MKYYYLEAMTEDVKEYIKDNYTTAEQLTALEDREEWENTLHDALWIEDSVTGNASGSYTFNRYTAKEYVIENIDILNEAVQEFCIESETVRDKFLNEDWEHFDVCIRCYLLLAAISKAIEEMTECGDLKQ